MAFTYRERRDAADAVLAAVRAESPDARCEAYQLDVRDSAAVERVGDQVLEDVRHGSRGRGERGDHPRRAWPFPPPTRTGAT